MSVRRATAADSAAAAAVVRAVFAEHDFTWDAGGYHADLEDVEASFDGTRVVFALHLPLIEGADPEDQPTWNIWEYDATTRQLRRVIPSDIVAEEGDDIMPHYLPDGRIVLRDSKDVGLPPHHFTPTEWNAFLAGVRAGEFDLK